jgi:purine-cytosine permease-like protein
MTTRIEAHGIDVIPDGERYGHARSLFAVWAAANVSYLYIVLGGALVLLGLNVWQALAVVAAGNAFWLLVGWLSVSGPASGTPSEVVTRALFGIRGNRVYNALEGWGVGVAYEAINLAVASLAALALAEACGLHATTAVKWAAIAGTALIAVTISVYGHAMIVRLSGWFTGALAAGMVVLGCCVLGHAHWGYAPPRQAAPHGGAPWVAVAVGFTIIASSPLSWGVGDFIQALSDLLALTVTFLGPALAIYGVDIWLRRNRYDGRALHDETPGSPFWYCHGVSPAGAAAMIAGTAAVLCVSTTVYSGPVATALSGADLSALAGPALAAPVYYALARKKITNANTQQAGLSRAHHQPMAPSRGARRLTA